MTATVQYSDVSKSYQPQEAGVELAKTILSSNKKSSSQTKTFSGANMKHGQVNVS